MDKINKELFIQDLNSKYTLLQEVNYLVKNIVKIIDIINTTDTDIINELKTYIDSIKNYIIQNENTTEIGGDLEVDGYLTLNSSKDLLTKDGTKLGERSYEHYVRARIDGNIVCLSYTDNKPEVDLINYLLSLNSNMLSGAFYLPIICNNIPEFKTYILFNGSSTFELYQINKDYEPQIIGNVNVGFIEDVIRVEWSYTV